LAIHYAVVAKGQRNGSKKLFALAAIARTQEDKDLWTGRYKTDKPVIYTKNAINYG
jgi:hypothetical protein